MDGRVSPGELPEAPDNTEWKRVKYIKSVPRKFKENLELRFKDVVHKVGAAGLFKKELEDFEQARKNKVVLQKERFDEMSLRKKGEECGQTKARHCG